jgi:hypothetical protein
MQYSACAKTAAAMSGDVSQLWPKAGCSQMDFGESLHLERWLQ